MFPDFGPTIAEKCQITDEALFNADYLCYFNAGKILTEIYSKL